MIVLALALGSANLACSGKPGPDPDGVPLRLTGYRAGLQEVLVDADQQTWFLITPKGDRRAPALLCRLRAGVVTCGSVPGTEPAKGYEQTARLLEPGFGAIPLVAVSQGEGARYLEPFTWRVARAFEHIPFSRDGLVLADGTIMVHDEDADQLTVARPNGALVRFDLPMHASLSRFGALWLDVVETGPSTAAFRLMSAPLGADGLGPPREHAMLQGLPSLSKGCREGNTLGFVEDAVTTPVLPALDHDQLVMMDLESGVTQRISIKGFATKIRCRPGSVAALTTDDRYPSALCDAQGCRTVQTPPAAIELREHGLTLVDGAIMMIAPMADSKVMTWRIGEPPRVWRHAGERLPHSRVAEVPSGAIAFHYYGELLAFDHQGRIEPLTLIWSGPPANSRAEGR